MSATAVWKEGRGVFFLPPHRPQDLNQRRPLDHPDQSVFRESVNIAMHQIAAVLVLCIFRCDAWVRDATDKAGKPMQFEKIFPYNYYMN